jgi:hypothetical protein
MSTVPTSAQKRTSAGSEGLSKFRALAESPRIARVILLKDDHTPALQQPFDLIEIGHRGYRVRDKEGCIRTHKGAIAAECQRCGNVHVLVLAGQDDDGWTCFGKNSDDACARFESWPNWTAEQMIEGNEAVNFMAGYMDDDPEACDIAEAVWGHEPLTKAHKRRLEEDHDLCQAVFRDKREAFIVALREAE